MQAFMNINVTVEAEQLIAFPTRNIKNGIASCMDEQETTLKLADKLWQTIVQVINYKITIKTRTEI